MQSEVTITIITKDRKGNRIVSEETRILTPDKSSNSNPEIENYFEIFTNVLSKQEFKPEEIANGLRNFFVGTDIKKMSL